jgi:hypothetical protein
METTDCPLTNCDAEYDLIKQFLLVLDAHPEWDCSWDAGRIWRMTGSRGTCRDRGMGTGR